jgi:cytochrome P450
MIIVETGDFVQLFAESFEIASNADGTGRAPEVKPTCPRWHELRELPFIADPYPTLAAVRESGPARVIGELGDAPVWLVTRYEDARTVLAHLHVSNDFYDAPWWVKRARELGVAPPADDHHSRNLPLAMEDERHVRARTVLVKAVNARRVDAVRPVVERTAAELLDALPVGEPVDVNARFAVPLANTALAAVLGIPPDMALTYPGWSDQINSHMLDPQTARVAAGKFYGFVAALMREKRNTLADDVLSDLWRARDDGILSDFEMHGLVALLLHAGQEAPAAVTNGLLSLLRHPEQLAKILSDPSSLPSSIEELLRYESSLAQALPRHTKSHLAFGHGTRRCVGACLGTMVATIGLDSLLRRYPAVRLAHPDQPTPWRPSTFSRRVESLSVVLAESLPTSG